MTPACNAILEKVRDLMHLHLDTAFSPTPTAYAAALGQAWADVARLIQDLEKK